MAKPDAIDFAAERYEMKQLKKGVPHPTAEKMEKTFMRNARGKGEDKGVRRSFRGSGR